MLFFLLNYSRILVESAFYMTKKGGGGPFCRQKRDMREKKKELQTSCGGVCVKEGAIFN